MPTHGTPNGRSCKYPNTLNTIFWLTVLLSRGCLGAIYIPGSETTSPCWSPTEYCCLGGPEELAGKVSVEAIYTKAFANRGTNLDMLFRFFRHTLDVPQFLWTDLVEDLRVLKRRGYGADDERIGRTYKRLMELAVGQDLR